jgi:predicted dehydrogenase
MVLLIGSGPMAVEYAKVLKAQGRDFKVIGRGAASAALFKEKTGLSVLTGGLDELRTSGKLSGTSAIVAVGVDMLYETSIALLKLGIKHLLIEKPGILHPAQIHPLRQASQQADASVYVAFNRRFYSSVRRAEQIITEEGGLTSFTFDFTEWAQEIVKLETSAAVKERWVLGNSSHVLDLAFFLGGIPQELTTYRTRSLSWHPDAAVFVGSGVSVKGAPFSFHANWDAPGRWGLEFCTSNYKLILRPIERLQVMNKGTIKIEDVDISDEDARVDVEFKPGLFRLVDSFFAHDTRPLCTLEEFEVNLRQFCLIAGYT